MDLIEKVFMLKKCSLFKELDLDYLFAISEKLSTLSFGPGAEIFPCDQEAHKLYFIAKGEVEIKDNDHTLVATLPCNAYFGEEALFNDLPRAYSAQAKGNVILFSLSKTHFFTILLECPTVSVAMLYDYAGQNCKDLMKKKCHLR